MSKTYRIYANCVATDEMEIEADSEQEAEAKFFEETTLDDPVIESIEEIEDE